MAKTVTIEVTPEEAEAFESIRLYADLIARAARRFKAEFPDGKRLNGGRDPWSECSAPGGLPTALYATLGEDSFWTPHFWLLLSCDVAVASDDPSVMSKSIGKVLGWSVAKTAAERDKFKAWSDASRADLEALASRLRGRHRAGRVKRVDEQATEDAVYRLAREIENVRGEERGSTRRAKARLAPAMGVKPGTLTKRITRRARRIT